MRSCATGSTVTEPIFTSARFTDAATLADAEPHHFEQAYTAVTQPCPWPKAYGGDLVAAAAAAAIRSISDGKTLHSLHSYFLRPAEVGAIIRYEVERLRDGRRFSTRTVRAFQNDKPIFAAMAGFAAEDPDAAAYRGEMTVTVPDPDELPSAADYLEKRCGGAMTPAWKSYWSGERSFDMRHVPEPVYLRVEGIQRAQQAVWIKPFDALRPIPGLDDDHSALVALAYVCDYTILEPVLRVLGYPWADPRLSTASLDHAMWFHRRRPVDDWLLYTQSAVAADGGRGVGQGRFYTREGIHLATVVQEGLISMAEDHAPPVEI
ncbi:acyl-CoA thioesterase domain-containing protein [Mycobacterium syngnathidarum]